MKLMIHDVGHGACISFLHKNGNSMVWDTGHLDEYKPSKFLPINGITKIDRLFITNYDQDHISDLPDVVSKLGANLLHRNKSLSVDQLRQIKLKSGPISPAMNTMLGLMDSYTGSEPSVPPAFPDVEFSVYCHDYSADYQDTNNLSLVTFVKIMGVQFIIPGDLERKGWLGHLTNPRFVSDLRNTNVFIASHHGRENGYCAEVFEYCKPAFVVISDAPIQFETQEASSQYAKHASGGLFNGGTRKVLSTRNDGTLWWSFE